MTYFNFNIYKLYHEPTGEEIYVVFSREPGTEEIDYEGDHQTIWTKLINSPVSRNYFLSWQVQSFKDFTEECTFEKIDPEVI